MYLNLSKHIQSYLNIFKHIQTYTNISDFCTYPNISELNATISEQVTSLIVLKKDMIKETNLLIYTFHYTQKFCRYVIGTLTYTIKSVMV